MPGAAPAVCLRMLSREHIKQNLWSPTDGHWTKCTSSSCSAQSVQRSAVSRRTTVDDSLTVGGGAVATPDLAADGSDIGG